MITYNKLRKNITTQLADIHNKTYTVIGITAITVLILVVFAIRPVFFTLSDEIATVSDLQSQDSKIKTNVANLASDISVYNSRIKANDGILALAMPKTAETGVLFANMNALANLEKISIDNVNFLNQSDLSQQSYGQSFASSSQHIVPGTNKLYFILNGSGNPTDVENYVSQLEQFPRVINLTEITIASSTAQNGVGNPVGSFTIKGYVYYL